MVNPKDYMLKSNIINVLVEDNWIQINITNREKEVTCGWLLMEVSKEYTQLLIK